LNCGFFSVLAMNERVLSCVEFLPLSLPNFAVA
jgi:hypothetical protein